MNSPAYRGLSLRWERGFGSLLAIGFVLSVIFFALSQTLAISTRNGPDLDQQLNSLRAEYRTIAAQELVNAKLSDAALASAGFDIQTECAKLETSSLSPLAQVTKFAERGVTMTKVNLGSADQCVIRVVACVKSDGAGCSGGVEFFARRASSQGLSVSVDAGVAANGAVFELRPTVATQDRLAIVSGAFSRKNEETTGANASATCQLVDFNPAVPPSLSGCNSSSSSSWTLSTPGAPADAVGGQGFTALIPGGKDASIRMNLSQTRFGALTGLVLPATAELTIFGNYVINGCDDCFTQTGSVWRANRTLTNGFQPLPLVIDAPVTQVLTNTTGTNTSSWTLTVPAGKTLVNGRLDRVTLWAPGVSGGNQARATGSNGGGGGAVTVLEGDIPPLRVTSGSAAACDTDRFTFFFGNPAGVSATTNPLPTFFSQCPLTGTYSETNVNTLVALGQGGLAYGGRYSAGAGGPAWTAPASWGTYQASNFAKGGNGAARAANTGGRGGTSAGSVFVDESTTTRQIGDASAVAGFDAVNATASSLPTAASVNPAVTTSALGGGTVSANNTQGLQGNSPGGGGGGGLGNKGGGSGGSGQIVIQYRTETIQPRNWCEQAAGQKGADLLVFGLAAGTKIGSTAERNNSESTVTLNLATGVDVPMNLVAHFPREGQVVIDGQVPPDIRVFSEIFYVFNPYVYGTVTGVTSGGTSTTGTLSINCTNCDEAKYAADAALTSYLKFFNGSGLEYWGKVDASSGNSATVTVTMQGATPTLSGLIGFNVCGGICAFMKGVTSAATTPFTVQRTGNTDFGAGFVCIRAGTKEGLRKIAGSTTQSTGYWNEEISD